MRHTTSRPGTWSAGFFELNAVNGNLGDFGSGDPGSGVGITNRVGVFDRCPRVVGHAGDRAFDRRVEADG